MGATPYPCMKQEDINRLPVLDIAAKDCVLFPGWDCWGNEVMEAKENET